MDWLSRNTAKIDCKKKQIVMFIEDNIRESFQGQKEDKKFFSIMQAKKLSKQGCKAYLTHVVGTKKEAPKLEEVSVVNKFPKVFPNELLGLPPDHEIEFSIDLVTEAEPVSKAPYRMAPVEMKELANQLQELLDKGVIRASYLPGVHWYHL
ncbi:uncharacterized protein LOC141690535 [Apium graveolens]|uniref:uncharacterized protein LOC141690535 n=1 Tax=Apium graveolens TaxID=4045 RepID=UPI003D79BC18